MWADFDLADIKETANLIAPYIEVTPTIGLRSRSFEEQRSARSKVILKLELLQVTGTFKVRGALSNLLRLGELERDRGIVAVSGGNHAIAAAYAASILGIDAKVVMITPTSPARIEAAKAFGADVICIEGGAAAFAAGEEIARREKRIYLHPFEGRLTSLGAATLGLELLTQLESIDVILVAIGGGGLASGVAAAVKYLRPNCRVIGVEPVGSNVMYRSIESGRPEKLSQMSTIATSLAAPMAMPYSFELCRKTLDRVVLVSDADIRKAMAILFGDSKLAVEPAGAATVAALLGPLREELDGLRVAAIVCGSNIDVESFASDAVAGRTMLREHPAAQGGRGTGE